MRMRTLRHALRHATQAKYSRSNKRSAQQSMQETESRTSNANRVEAVAAECWPSCTPAAHGIERGISDHAVESLTLGMPARRHAAEEFRSARSVARLQTMASEMLAACTASASAALSRHACRETGSGELKRGREALFRYSAIREPDLSGCTSAS